MIRRAAILCMLLAAPVGAQEADAPAAPAPGPADAPMERLDSKFDLRRKVGEMIAKRDKDPVGYILGDMKEVTEFLTDLKTADPTQPQQTQIVVALDKLIEELENQQKKKSAKPGSGGDTPLPDSVIAGGRRGGGPPRDPRGEARAWGQLPPKQREQILQSQNEGFPAGFESILSSYYKRLAQESVDAVADASEPASATVAPTTQP